MYSNESAVLGASTIVVPTFAGIAIWPNLTLGILAIAILALGIMFFVFKRRNKK